MERFGDHITPPEEEGKEKHVPIIHAPDSAKAGEPFEVTIVVGEETPHPSELKHSIRDVELWAKYKDSPKPILKVASAHFGATLTRPTVTFHVTLEESATLFALEYCNIHGEWDYSVDIEITE